VRAKSTHWYNRISPTRLTLPRTAHTSAEHFEKLDVLENVAMISLQQQCQMSRRSLTEQRDVAVEAVKSTSFDSNNTYRIVL